MFNMNYNRKGCLNNSTAKCVNAFLLVFKLCKFIWQTIPGRPKEIAMKTELCEELFICVLVWLCTRRYYTIPPLRKLSLYSKFIFPQRSNSKFNLLSIRNVRTWSLVTLFIKCSYIFRPSSFSLFLPSYLQNSIIFSRVSGSSFNCYTY